MLGFLLAAEVIAATAVVSEAALIYVARKRNMMISLAMLALEAGLAVGADPDHEATRACRRHVQATGPGDRACASRSASPRSPSRGCSSSKLGAPVSGWRWDLVWAAAAGVVVGARVRYPAARDAGS